MMPKRIQRRRTKGWKTPPNTIYVGRPTRWGNPWYAWPHEQSGWWFVRGPGINEVMNRPCGNKEGAVLVALDLYRKHAEKLDLSELRGKNLACWCSPEQPCHADVLIELANATLVADQERVGLRCRQCDGRGWIWVPIKPSPDGFHIEVSRDDGPLHDVRKAKYQCSHCRGSRIEPPADPRSTEDRS